MLKNKFTRTGAFFLVPMSVGVILSVAEAGPLTTLIACVGVGIVFAAFGLYFWSEEQAQTA